MGGSVKYSERALRALGAFGLTTDDAQSHHAHRLRDAAIRAAHLDAAISPGQVALIRGASGSGKSTLLRLLAARLRESNSPVVVVQPPAATRSRTRVIDLLARTPADVPAALRILAATGLADAFIPAQRPAELSDGQRARLAIALAMTDAHALARPGIPTTIILDELAGTLDNANGRGLCLTLARWVRDSGQQNAVRLFAATARDDVEAWLAPDTTLDLDQPDAPIPHTHRLVLPPPVTPRISRGTLADYHRLAHLHYRAARPATCIRVLLAHLNDSRTPVGVLTVSMPTLNGAWRSLAWPGDYDGPSRRENAARLNRDLRCISRVIVDPRFRARGVGGALIRAYLAAPLTRRTEAVAAMGAACPLFLRAGMREWTPPPARRDSRLIDALDRAHLRPWMLADIHESLEAIARHPHLERALRTWARDHGPTRPLASAPARDLIRAAARSIINRPRAYTAEHSLA